jgi:hypothetical protein
MPKLRTETFGAGDQSWLGSAHAIHEARTETVDISAFTPATHYPNGYLPSGTPVAKVAGLLVPYDKTEATVTLAGILAGHILTDQPIPAGSTQDFAAPLLDHGRVKVAKVPYNNTFTFAAPVAAAKAAATTIVYL